MDKKKVLRKSRVFHDPFAKTNVDYTSQRLLSEIQLGERFDAATAKIQGQDAALRKIKQKLTSASNANPTHPQVLFLAGPPGCGKSVVAICCAEAKNTKYLILDGSRMQDPQVFQTELYSLPQSFRDAIICLLTKFLIENPTGVVIIEEPDKAHPLFINILLQMITTGNHFDQYLNRNINVRNNTFVFCSNTCKDLWTGPNRYNLTSTTPLDQIIASLEKQTDALDRRVFSDAFISRVAGSLVLFNALTPNTIQKIVAERVKDEVLKLHAETKIELDLDSIKIAEKIVLESGCSDLRILLASVEQTIQDFRSESSQLSHQLAEDKNRFLQTIKVQFDFSDANEDAIALLNGSSGQRILVSPSAHMYLKDTSFGAEVITTNAQIKPESLRSKKVTLAILDLHDENTRRAFAAISAQKVAIPTYVYAYSDDGENDAYLASELSYFSERGAIETYASANIGPYIQSLLESLPFSNAIAMLSKSRKVLNWRDSLYTYNPDTFTMTVSFHGVSLDTAKNPEEKGVFVADADRPTASFDDIVGCDHAKEVLKLAADSVANPQRYTFPTRSVIMCGPPGCGKTLLGQATACYSGFEFIYRNATSFLDKYVGEGVQKIKQIFAYARRVDGCVIFVDEIDTILRDRSSEHAQNGHTDDLTGCLLSELESPENEGILFIGATNFAIDQGTTLDPAALRRFDEKLTIGKLSCSDRKVLIKKVLEKIPRNTISEELITSLSMRTAGWSASDITRAIQNGSRDADRDDTPLNDSTLKEKFDSFNDGERVALNEQQMEQTAWHEAGHVCVAYFLNQHQPIVCCSIESRSKYAGFMQLEETDKACFSREDILQSISIALGGRASEEMKYGNRGITTGASDDLNKAINSAKQLITAGLDNEKPFAYIGFGLDSKNVCDRAADIIEKEYNNTKAIIAEHYDKVEAVAKQLLQSGFLDQQTLLNLLGNNT